MDLDRKCTFITGGASGIGLAMAKSLSKVGARIVLADIDSSALEAALEVLRDAGAEAYATRFDVSNLASWRDAANDAESAMGPVHILCNNAGVGSAKAEVDAITEDYWRWIFDINVHGVRNGVATFLPRMKARGERCHILNTASILGFFARPGNSDYVATKFAVVGLSEALRMELAGSNIGVSVLCPGLVVTPLARNTRELRPRAASDSSAQSPAGPGGIESSVGIGAEAVGDIVVESLRDERFYVFTHPDYRAASDRRFEEIHSAMSSAPKVAGAEDPDLLANGVLSLASAMVALKADAIALRSSTSLRTLGEPAKVSDNTQ